MKERFKASLPANFILPTTDQELQSALTQLFNDQGMSFNNLAEALKAENREKYGLPEISNISFEVIKFEPELIKGRIKVNYNLHITFSCSAIITHQNNQHSYWDFDFNKHFNELYFVGDEYGDIRSTLDEF
jgi:hypothetical protein